MGIEMAMERYPLRIKWTNPDTGYEETFVYVGRKGNFVIYMGQASSREVILSAEQALAAPRA